MQLNIIPKMATLMGEEEIICEREGLMFQREREREREVLSNVNLL
jgi:hypothetical protein